jgi:hypothetical protein
VPAPPVPDTGDARIRMGEVLRKAWSGAEDAPLEEETQRLMLHLSIEPIETERPGPISEARAARPARRSLLRRLLRRPAGGLGA